MENFLDLKRKVSALINQSYQLTTKLGYTSSAENIKEIKTAFENKELMIVTIGEAKRGKSSLLNALLNETEPLFPVDMNVCTNVVTIVRYGATETVEVLFEDPSAKGGIRREIVDRKNISDYVSEKGNPNNYKNIKSLQVTIPNQLLKEGVVFVDTPGVGSLNINHAETTYSFLPSADIVLFVSDVGSGYTESELNFLKRTYNYCKNIIFPVTKKDLSMNYQEIVNDNINKITNTLDISAEDVQIIPVSSTAKMRYLKNGNKSMYINSNFKTLETSIWTTIAKSKAEILLRSFAADLKAELDKLYNGIIAQNDVLTANKDEVKALLAAFDEESEQVKRYQNEGAKWKNQLNYLFQELSLKTGPNGIPHNINMEAMDKLEHTVMELDTQICEENKYTELLMDINDIISMGTLDIKDIIQESVNLKIAEIRNELSLDIDITESAFERIKFSGKSKISIEFKKQKVSDRIISSGRNIGMDSMGAGRIGAMVGGVLGGVLGCFIGNPIAGVAMGYTLGSGAGSLLGGAKGCVNALSKYGVVEVNTVKKEITKYINSAIKNVNLMISEVTLELKKQLNEMFERDLKKRITEIQENMTRIKENVNLVQSDIPKKQNLLKQQKDAVLKLENAWTSIDNELSGFASKYKLENNTPVDTDVKIQNSNTSNNDNKSEQGGDGTSYGFL